MQNYQKIILNNLKVCGLIITSDSVSDTVATYNAESIISQELLVSPIVLCTSRHSKYAKETELHWKEKLSSENMVAISGGKQNLYTTYNEHDLYTTNLDIVRKRLLYNEDAYVMMSEPIAYKKLIDKDIVLLQKTNNTSKINFLYNIATTYPANFLARLAQELKNAISN
jgi:hypothetical protein